GPHRGRISAPTRRSSDLGDGLDKALERLFDQRRITLLDSSIRISPWEQPDWEFTNGDLTLINRGSRHRLDARLSLPDQQVEAGIDRKSTRLTSSHGKTSY